jgi:hypothetical protein
MNTKTTKAETETEEMPSEESGPEWGHHVENDWVVGRLSEAEIAARLANAGLQQSRE